MKGRKGVLELNIDQSDTKFFFSFFLGLRVIGSWNGRKGGRESRRPGGEFTAAGDTRGPDSPGWTGLSRGV